MPETNTTLPPAVDENYANFIFNYNSSPSYLAYLKQNYQVSVINSTYAIIYVPLDGFELLSPNSYSYGSIPKCYAPMDVESMNASGITRIHNQPYIPYPNYQFVPVYQSIPYCTNCPNQPSYSTNNNYYY